MAMVKCLVCGAVFEAGVKVCPVCGVGPEHFVPLEETSATPQGTNRRFLVLGGGIGNLIDRVLNGEVVDYINLLFMRFAVFNFADICVCVGVALWVLVIFLEESHSGNADAPKEP